MEETKTKKNKLLTVKRVALVVVVLSALWLIAFIVWESLNSKVGGGPAIGAQQVTKETAISF